MVIQQPSDNKNNNNLDHTHVCIELYPRTTDRHHDTMVDGFVHALLSPEKSRRSGTLSRENRGRTRSPVCAQCLAIHPGVLRSREERSMSLLALGEVVGLIKRASRSLIGASPPDLLPDNDR